MWEGFGESSEECWGGGLGAAGDCYVSTSKRRHPVDLQSEKFFMGAFFLLEILPWPVALMVSLLERQGSYAIGEI